MAPSARGEDMSAPAILQVFEAKWDTIEDRMADIFRDRLRADVAAAAGAGRYVAINRSATTCSTGSISGSPRNETLYGTETGLKTTITEGHKAGMKFFTDFMPNHNGYGNAD